MTGRRHVCSPAVPLVEKHSRSRWVYPRSCRQRVSCRLPCYRVNNIRPQDTAGKIQRCQNALARKPRVRLEELFDGFAASHLLQYQIDCDARSRNPAGPAPDNGNFLRLGFLDEDGRRHFPLLRSPSQRRTASVRIWQSGHRSPPLADLLAGMVADPPADAGQRHCEPDEAEGLFVPARSQ